MQPSVINLEAVHQLSTRAQFRVVIDPHLSDTTVELLWSYTPGGPYSIVQLPSLPAVLSSTQLVADIAQLLPGANVYWAIAATNADGTTTSTEQTLTGTTADLGAVPCGWQFQSCCTVENPDPDAVKFAEAAAASVLWALSGRRYGLCERTVRPCRKRCLPNWWQASRADAWYWPNFADYGAGAFIGGLPWPTCGCNVDDCSCTTSCILQLPLNTTDVTQVIIDGAVVPPDQYRLDAGGQLRLLDPTNGCWPECQDMNLPISAAGTWAVRYRAGTPLPPAGALAVGTFACEILKACIGLSCNLPARVQTITRAGTTIALLDPQAFLEKGLTGVYLVDIWLQSCNPQKLRRAGRVYRADDPNRKRLR